jgi:hypothetical protein
MWRRSRCRCGDGPGVDVAAQNGTYRAVVGKSDSICANGTSVLDAVTVASATPHGELVAEHSTRTSKVALAS